MRMVDMDLFRARTFRSSPFFGKFRSTGVAEPDVPRCCPTVHLRQVFGCDVFAHAKQIGGFTPGTEVSFAILLNKDSKPQAFDIEELSPSPNSMGKGKGAMMVKCSVAEDLSVHSEGSEESTWHDLGS